MGVYLYGEMVISRTRELRQLAEKCFSAVSAEMEDGARKAVRTMIYGDET